MESAPYKSVILLLLCKQTQACQLMLLYWVKLSLFLPVISDGYFYYADWHCNIIHFENVFMCANGLLKMRYRDRYNTYGYQNAKIESEDALYHCINLCK